MGSVTELIAPTVAQARVHKVVGASITRPDAAAKVLGRAVYAGDFRLPGMAHGKVVRSPHARARVTGVDVSRALSMPGVLAVLTAADVTGQNGVGTLQFKDQPVLAPGQVNFAGEAVALVLAETEELASAAAGLVGVEYELLPPVTDPAEALTDAAPQIHQGGNLCRELRIVRGDFDAAAARASLVVVNTYRTQWSDHGSIESDAVVGRPDGEGVILHVSTKSPHSDQAEVARVLGVAKERVRIVAATVGGSFGGKPDIPLLCLAAMAARHLRRPVRLAMTRQECLLAKLKRHPFRITATHAVANDGELLGVRIEALADAGAYALSSPSVVAKAIVHATGPYRVGAVDLHGRVAYTNNPVTSAVRGYGVPQVVFAAERQMDVIARRLGIDPIDLRRRNALRKGDVTATGHVLAEAGLLEALEAVERRAREIGCPQTESPRERRAWGVAACFYGCGRMGTPDHARVSLKLEPEGTVRLFVGAPETGQGSDTALAQIAAEELGMPFALLRVTSADTGLCYDAGLSSASRVTYVVGSAVQIGARALKGRLLAALARKTEGDPDRLPTDQAALAALARFCAGRGFAIDAEGEFFADSGPLDDEGQGRPFGAYTFGAQMSRVRVDMETGAVEVEETVGCFDAGTVVNPVQFQGQMQGAAAMAQGLALTEEILVRDGVPLNTTLHTYLMPTAADVPGLEALAVEATEPTGPFGAKGVGEPAILPGAAAVANAVAAALGVEVRELPLTPERVLRLVRSG
jgi:CO/xanthine dehydrogenase Mo-binding subunit